MAEGMGALRWTSILTGALSATLFWTGFATALLVPGDASGAVLWIKVLWGAALVAGLIALGCFLGAWYQEKPEERRPSEAFEVHCRDIGGRGCTFVATGSTPEQAHDAATDHVHAAHPEAVAQVSEAQLDALRQRIQEATRHGSHKGRNISGKAA